MSGIKITSIDPINDPNWVFENKKNFLTSQFGIAILNLEKLINGYKYNEEFSSELNVIERASQDLYQSFTAAFTEGNVSPADLDRIVNSLIVKLNEQILAVQMRIEQYSIELRTEAKIRERKILEMADRFEGERNLSGFKSEVTAIKNELAAMSTDQLPLERLNQMKTIENVMESLLHQHEIAITINLEGIVEHQYTPITRQRESPGGTIKTSEIVAEIHRYYILLQELDPESILQYTTLVKEVDTLPEGQRIQLIHDNLALSYGQIKESLAWTNVYRHLLEDMISDIDGKSGYLKILAKIIGLKSEKTIDRAVFAQVQLEYLNAVQQNSDKAEQIKYKTSVLRELSSRLSKMGYSVTNHDMNTDSIVQNILSGKEVYCDTKWEGDKIQITMNKFGEIVTRIVKIIKKPDSEKIQSHESFEQDLMVAKSWHASYDILMEHLRKTGFCMKTEMEKMPSEVQLEIISSDVFEQNKRAGRIKQIDIEELVKRNG